MSQQETHVLQVIPKAPLKFYYVILPVVDTSLRFLGRFGGPLETIYKECAITHNMNLLAKKTTEEQLKEVALRQWNEMIDEATGGIELPEEVKWMKEYTDLQLIECEIVPKVGVSNG
jgi:hypothetical protein